jgi:hypothetical protein
MMTGKESSATPEPRSVKTGDAAPDARLDEALNESFAASNAVLAQHGA